MKTPLSVCANLEMFDFRDEGGNVVIYFLTPEPEMKRKIIAEGKTEREALRKAKKYIRELTVDAQLINRYLIKKGM